MATLQQLAEKIAQLKTAFESLKEDNAKMKAQLENATREQADKDQTIAALRQEAERAQSLSEELERVRRELRDKVEEIEKIVAQVEALLAE